MTTTRLLRGARESALWFGALVGLLAVAAGIAAVVVNASFLVFRSGSMSPAIDTGALAVARPVEAQDVRPGDIVSVQSSDGSRITHRVVSSTVRGDEASLVLQGDANSTPDREVYVIHTAERIGWSVPYAGYVVAYALTPAGLAGIGSLCAALFLVAPADPVGPRQGPGGRHRDRPCGRRRGTGRRAVVAGTVVAATVAATVVTGTQAAFSDNATMTSGSFSARTLTAPTAVTCVNSSFNDYITWTAPTGPAPTGYRVHYTNNLTSVTRTQDVATSPLQWRPPTTPTATYTVRVAALRGSWVSSQSATSDQITGQVVVVFNVYRC